MSIFLAGFAPAQLKERRRPNCLDESRSWRIGRRQHDKQKLFQGIPSPVLVGYHFMFQGTNKCICSQFVQDSSLPVEKNGCLAHGQHDVHILEPPQAAPEGACDLKLARSRARGHEARIVALGQFLCQSPARGVYRGDVIKLNWEQSPRMER